jgi:hypothetical protein
MCRSAPKKAPARFIFVFIFFLICFIAFLSASQHTAHTRRVQTHGEKPKPKPKPPWMNKPAFIGFYYLLFIIYKQFFASEKKKRGRVGIFGIYRILLCTLFIGFPAFTDFIQVVL